MKLNLDAIKEQIDALDNPQSGGQSGGNDKLYKLNPGSDEVSAIVKVVPNKADLTNPFMHLHFHYGLPGMNSMLCPKKMKNESCSVCDLGSKFYNDQYKDENDEDKKKMIRDKLFSVLFPNQRVFLPVVQMDELDKGVRWWGFSDGIYQQLIRDAYKYGQEGVDFTDPTNSPEFEITVISNKKVLANGKRNKYNKTDIVACQEGLTLKLSALHEDPKEIKKILATCPDIYEVYSYRSESDIKTALAEFIKGFEESNDEPEDDGSNGTEKYSSKSQDKSEAKTGSKESIDSIREQFEQKLAASEEGE